MALSLFEALKKYAGFRGEDEKTLRELHPLLRGHFPAIIEDFYRQIALNEGTRRILRDPEQVERLKKTLLLWLEEAFLGPHDASYFDKRNRIGLVHVHVGLPQAYVFGAMSHIRRQLDQALEQEAGADPGLVRRGRLALAKILDIDLSVIAGSYHEAEKYRDLVEFAPEMIHQVDRDGRILAANRTECERLGYDRNDLVGRRLEDFIEDADREAFRAHVERVFQHGESRCEARIISAKGERIFVEILATGVRDPVTREVVQARAYLRDIGERKRAEDALRREKDSAQRYLDISGSIICVLDPAGRFILMNRTGCEILGYREEEVLGRGFEILIPEKDRKEIRAVFDSLMAGDIAPSAWYENPVLTQTGQERIIQWHNAAFREDDGRMAGILCSGIDITERKRMERTLVEQASLARLGELVAVVAHEIKNPIAGISGALQIIHGQLPLASTGREITKDILERLAALNDSVNDLLLFARPRLPRPAPVPLLTLIQDIVSLVLKDPKLQKVQVQAVGPDLVVPCDAELLKPAFLNIVLNAVQAMKGDGRLDVALEAVDGRCRVSISDTGPGIPDGLREKVFEPFFSTKHQGTGLGLPITKRIVEAHGGAVEIDGRPGGGTIVHVFLPLGQPKAA